MSRRSNLPRLVVETVAIIASVEMAIMLALPWIAPSAGDLTAAALDTAALTLLAGPLILWRGLAASSRSASAEHAEPAAAAHALRLTVGTVLALGLVCSALGAWRMWQGMRASEEAQFELLSERVRVETERRLRSHSYGLRGARGAIIANPSLRRAQFREYLASRDLPNEFPGVKGFGYVERVPREALRDYAARVRAEDDPGFTISTAGDRPEAYVTRLLEPPGSDPVALGWDVATDAARRDAAERAMSTGEVMCARRAMDADELAGSPCLVCFLPVYRGDLPSATEEERRRALLGWVYSAASIEQMLTGIAEAASGWVDVEVYDGAETVEESLRHASGQSWPGAVYRPIQERESAWIAHRRVAIDSAGLHWTLLLAPSPAFERALDHGTPIFLGVAGALLTVLLALLTWSMGSGRARALALANSMTAELRASEHAALTTLARLSSYRATLDRHAIVAVTDAAARLIEVNELFCRESGYSRDELVGADWRILNSGVHSRGFWSEMWRKLVAGDIWRADVCNKSKDGGLFWVDMTVGPIRDAAGQIVGYIGVGIDITDNKRNERELVEARDAASAASRAKSEFLASMSHEIRTPLTAILGFADMLREDASAGASAAQRSEALDTIRSAGRHLLAIINDVLDLSKIEAGKVTVEQIEAPVLGILREVEELMRSRAASKGVALEVRLGTPLPERVMSDPTRLRQILMNLVGNAVKFTQAGRVTVSARAEEPITLGGAPRLLIDVEDTGPGLTLEQERRLFAPFSQGDGTVTRQFGGTGLGLTICRRLAALMGGSVALARTEPGRGSCFRLELPMIAAPGAAMTTALGALAPVSEAAAAPAQVRLSGRILLAEDGPDNQRLIGTFLRRAGAEVAVAANGRVALEMIEQGAAAGTPYDLLVTDMQMPEMDGYTLARTLRQRGSKLSIVALTAHAMTDDRAKCAEAGCDDYASKPIDRHALLATCARWIGRVGGKRSRGTAAA